MDMLQLHSLFFKKFIYHIQIKENDDDICQI